MCLIQKNTRIIQEKAERIGKVNFSNLVVLEPNYMHLISHIRQPFDPAIFDNL